MFIPYPYRSFGVKGNVMARLVEIGGAYFAPYQRVALPVLLPKNDGDG